MCSQQLKILRLSSFKCLDKTRSKAKINSRWRKLNNLHLLWSSSHNNSLIRHSSKVFSKFRPNTLIRNNLQLPRNKRTQTLLFTRNLLRMFKHRRPPSLMERSNLKARLSTLLCNQEWAWCTRNSSCHQWQIRVCFNRHSHCGGTTLLPCQWPNSNTRCRWLHTTNKCKWHNSTTLKCLLPNNKLILEHLLLLLMQPILLLRAKRSSQVTQLLSRTSKTSTLAFLRKCLILS